MITFDVAGVYRSAWFEYVNGLKMARSFLKISLRCIWNSAIADEETASETKKDVQRSLKFGHHHLTAARAFLLVRRGNNTFSPYSSVCACYIRRCVKEICKLARDKIAYNIRRDAYILVAFTCFIWFIDLRIVHTTLSGRYFRNGAIQSKPTI